MAVKKELARENVPFMNLGAAGASLVDPIAPNLFSPLPNTTVVAQTLVNDRRLRKLCQLAGERHLVFRSADETAVRRALRELGYVLPPAH